MGGVSQAQLQGHVKVEGGINVQVASGDTPV